MTLRFISRTVALLIPCLFLFTESRADTSSSRSLWETVTFDLEASVHTSLSYVTMPGRFSGNDVLAVGSSTAVLAGLIALDRHTFRELAFASVLNDQPAANVLTAAKYLGQNSVVSGLALSTYAIGLFSQQSGLRITGRLLGESLLLSGLSTTVLKVVAGRARPILGNEHRSNPWDFYFFEFDDSFQAMASGHATAAFAVASVLAYRSESVLVGLLTYGTASLTGLERIQSKRHWLSDVLAGAAIGTLTGLYVCTREQQKAEGPVEESRLHFYPIGSGLGFAYTF